MDTKISAMPQAAPLTGSELVPVVQSGVNKRAAVGALLAPKPLDWLADVVAPSDTAAGHVLGTSGTGTWEPLNLAYLGEQIVGPLRAEIGDPLAVAVHTDLVGYIGEVADRVTALEATEAEVAADVHYFVDKYSGSFARVMVVPPTAAWPIKADLALAATPGTGGAVFPDLGSITGGAAVWADFGGALGRLNLDTGDAVYGSTLKEWIRRGSVLTVRRDDTDPAHPNLLVEKVERPAAAGSNIKVLDGVTFNNLKERTFIITDGAAVDLNPANGSLQTWVLTADRTPTVANFANGQSMKLRISGNFSITWPAAIVFLSDTPGSDGTPPTGPGAGFLHLELWKEQNILYAGMPAYSAT